MNAYRFSISWPRILPTGYDTYINMAGVNHYKNLINELRKINIEPVITLMHFDFPENNNFTFNFLSRDMPQLFANYARVVFREFGDQVKYWTTLNEPDMFCRYIQRAFTSATPPPGVQDINYECIRNNLLAHGMAYQVYQNEFKQQNGQIGWSIIPMFSRPNSTSYEDIQAAYRYNSFNFGLYLDPLIYGDFSSLVKQAVQKKSDEEGRKTSRLPVLSSEDQKIIKNTIDFIGLNVYFGKTVANAGVNKSEDTIAADADVIEIGTSSGGSGPFGNSFQKIEAWVIRETLLWARDHYPQKPIMITENGFETVADTVHDPERQVFFSQFLREMTRTINEDGVNVLGYFAWSLIDGYEWSRAYTSKMGLVRVDFESPNRTRTLKDSHVFFVKLMTDRVVPLVEDSQTTSSAGIQTYKVSIPAICLLFVPLIQVSL